MDWGSSSAVGYLPSIYKALGKDKEVEGGEGRAEEERRRNLTYNLM